MSLRDAPTFQTWHEPQGYQEFECTGAACGDTCCKGWGITVDQRTFDRYQQVADAELGAKLRGLVTITPAGSPKNYARIALQDATCPMHTDGLCGVQRELGAEYLGEACATFPRVVNQVAGAVERSLDLACPEAARRVLLNPEPAFFQEFSGPVTEMDERLLEVVNGRQVRLASAYDDKLRSFALWLLQNRAYQVSKRLLLLGFVISKLGELEQTGMQHLTLDTLDAFRLAIEGGYFDEHLQQSAADPEAQLTIVLELVVGRVALDYTSPRYRDLYNEFSKGLELRADSSITELGKRYAEVFFESYDPFMRTREHILEQYTVAYAYKNLFPAGAGSVITQYLLMAAYFAVTRTLVVGLAGFHREAFEEAHVVQAIQICARALEHCTSYPARMLEILGAAGIRVPAATQVLTQNPMMRVVR